MSGMIPFFGLISISTRHPSYVHPPLYEFLLTNDELILFYSLSLDPIWGCICLCNHPPTRLSFQFLFGILDRSYHCCRFWRGFCTSGRFLTNLHPTPPPHPQFLSPTPTQSTSIPCDGARAIAQSGHYSQAWFSLKTNNNSFIYNSVFGAS